MYYRSLDEEIKAERESGEFKRKMKNACAWCGVTINNSEGYYMNYGNSCKVCSSRHSKFVEGVVEHHRKVNKKTGKPYISKVKVREYTEQEKLSMLDARILEVKTNKNCAR